MPVIWLNRQSACLPERRKVCRNAVSLPQHTRWREPWRRSRAGFKLLSFLGHQGEACFPPNLEQPLGYSKSVLLSCLTSPFL